MSLLNCEKHGHSHPAVACPKCVREMDPDSYESLRAALSAERTARRVMREALVEAESLILWLSMKDARDKYGSAWRRCAVCERPSKHGYTDKQSHESNCAILLHLEKPSTRAALAAEPPEALLEELANHLRYVHPTPWRTGKKVARNVYDAKGEGVSMFAFAHTAAVVVEAINRLALPPEPKEKP